MFTTRMHGWKIWEVNHADRFLEAETDVPSGLAYIFDSQQAHIVIRR